MDNIVYIVTGTERSGSSLLSALLANSGAKFNMPIVEDWYRGSGAYEHEDYMRLIKHVKRSLFFKRFSDRLCNRERKKAIAIAKTLFKTSKFVKYPPFSEHIANIAKEAGFEPRIILIYRKFSDYLRSSMIKSGGTFNDHKQNYMSVNQTCFAQLFIYGGCAITYEELMDLDEVSWAKRLSNLCNLNEEVLLDFRSKTVKEFENINQIPQLDDEAAHLYQLISAHKNNIIIGEQQKMHS
ncbi:MAG: hypothetical protein ABJQ39_11290 [Winogradskyella arenosi]